MQDNLIGGGVAAKANAARCVVSTSENYATMQTGNEPNPAKVVNWSARRINMLSVSLGATRYLEIGVNKGTTFLDVDIAERTAVDPRFRLNPAEFESDKTHFFTVSSDKYFEDLALDSVFDICFLDGLHTFEQTLRDFCNTIIHSHARTVWLIDDTKPIDVFSAMPSRERAFLFRHSTGDKSVSWHGDVFKIVFFIHDFMPKLNYRTLSSKGNQQTLVWRSKRDQRSPRFNNLETISRMTYFELHDHLDIVRECSEDQGIQLCVDEVVGVSQRPTVSV